MRINYISDLHLESSDYAGEIAEGDVLVIAGDMIPASFLATPEPNYRAIGDRARRFVDRCAAKNPIIFGIMGNHEHWYGYYNATHQILSNELPQVHWLNNQLIELDDLLLYGGTGWTDMLGGDSEFAARLQRWADFEEIKILAPSPSLEALPFGPKEFVEANRAFKSGLHSAYMIASEQRKRLLVASHHLPTPEVVAGRWAGHPANPMFCDTGMPYVGSDRIPYWIHGHAHDRLQHQYGSTMIVRNPRGHERWQENSDFTGMEYIEV